MIPCKRLISLLDQVILSIGFKSRILSSALWEYFDDNPIEGTAFMGWVMRFSRSTVLEDPWLSRHLLLLANILLTAFGRISYL